MFNRARTAAQKKLRSRRRARWTMWFVTGVCAVVGVGIGVTQLVTGGFDAFVDRPPGVGASTSSSAHSTASTKKPSSNNSGSQTAPNPPPQDQPPDYLPPPPDARRGPRDGGFGP
jgi:hypothetical protein